MSYIEEFVELLKYHETNRTPWVEREKNIAALRARYEKTMDRTGEPYYVSLP
jgi:lysozyme family protein